MEGQRVVVVGGTSGMGLATVHATAALGADVVAAGRRPLAQREPVPGGAAAEVDVTDEESVRRLFEGVGPLDHVLVTASPGTPGAFLDQDLATARGYMDGKFFGSWTCACCAAPAGRGIDHLRDRRRGRASTQARIDDHGGLRRPGSAHASDWRSSSDLGE